MHKFKKHIINKNSKSNNFQIYIELLSDIPEKEITKAKNNNKSLSELPKKLIFLKLGNQFYKYDGIINMDKYIILSNFAFYVFIDFENEENMKKKASLYKKITGISNFFHLIPNKDRMDLKASSRNILDMLKKSFEGDKSFEERFSKHFEK